VSPTQLYPWLETRRIPGLFLAGQINGTSGYEEAAGQGLIAGINAAFRLLGRDPLVLTRHQAYIGVMIDDLVTRGTEEPYRMLSSRAEFRLLLREDNAAERLQAVAESVGLVKPEHLKQRAARQEELRALLRLLHETRGPGGGDRPTLEKLLRRPELGIQAVLGDRAVEYPLDVLEGAEVVVKYQGYIDRELRQVEVLRKDEGKRFPKGFDFSSISGLSRELKEKLTAARPPDLAHAARLDGMTPAALLLLSACIAKGAVPRGTNQEHRGCGEGGHND
jgi:tRNA uridine 5-carboxymethylaminomethyl modification enzyme